MADEALFVMRARYSAFALGNVEYILATTHPEHVDCGKDVERRRAESAHFSHSTVFKKLEILNVEKGEPFSYVTFRVFLEQEKKPLSFTERSTFERVDGKWLYLRGDFQGEFQQT